MTRAGRLGTASRFLSFLPKGVTWDTSSMVVKRHVQRSSRATESAAGLQIKASTSSASMQQLPSQKLKTLLYALGLQAGRGSA